MFLSCLFEVAANIIYFIANDVYCLVEARVLGGLGCGAGAGAVAYIAMSTTKKERTQMMGLIMAARQIGTMIGPGFNFGLALVDFQMGSLHIDADRAPGLFLMVLWAVGAVVVLLLFVDLVPPLRQRDEESERASLLGGVNTLSPPATPPSWRERWAWLLTLPVLSILVISFLLAFNQMTLETWVTPLTQHYFGWEERQNSLMYTGFGVVVLIAFVLLQVFSRRGMTDRVMMLSGIALEFATLVTMTSLISHIVPHTTTAYALILSTSGTLVFGLPFMFVTTPALLSKLVDEKYQGTSQGIRRVFMTLGTIVGPLWAGAETGNQVLMLGMMAGVFGVALVLMLVSYRKMIPHLAGWESQATTPGGSAASGPSEHTPLLTSSSKA